MSLFELGQALKAARIQRSLTQRDLSELTGVSLSAISGLERGTLVEMGAVKLMQLFAATGLELRPCTPGPSRTLDDIQNEYVERARSGKSIVDELSAESRRQRVRHSKKARQ